MVRLFANNTYPIGVDIGDDALTLAQMTPDGSGVRLLAADCIEYPADFRPGSAAWQRWAIKAVSESIARRGFRGKKLVSAQPPGEVYVDTFKVPKKANGQLENAIRNHLKPKIQMAPNDALIKHIRTDSDNILVMACNKTGLYRYLAMYEKARLKVASISVWPMAVLKAYAHFWAKHMGQKNDPVMLLDIRKKRTNIVICDSANLYFAHSSGVGAPNLEIDRMVDLLGSEMDMCRVKFRSTYKRPQVGHIIFVSGPAVDKNIYTVIAKRAKMSAQIGDCFDAAGVNGPDQADLKDRAANSNWITAMGLSLS